MSLDTRNACVNLLSKLKGLAPKVPHLPLTSWKNLKQALQITKNALALIYLPFHRSAPSDLLTIKNMLAVVFLNVFGPRTNRAPPRSPSVQEFPNLKE